MHLAARAGALDVLEVLLEDLEKADRLEYVNAADKSGITPVFLAKQRGLLPSFNHLYIACVVSCILSYMVNVVRLDYGNITDKNSIHSYLC